MGLRHYRILRIISLIVLFSFSWTFGGLFDIAYAVKYSDQRSGISSQGKTGKKDQKKDFQRLLKIWKVSLMIL
jgi:hypothetical protein